MMKKLYILAIAISIGVFSGCGNDDSSSKTISDTTSVYSAGESFTLSSSEKILNDSGDANVSISTNLSTGIVTASVFSGTVSVASK